MIKINRKKVAGLISTLWTVAAFLCVVIYVHGEGFADVDELERFYRLKFLIACSSLASSVACYFLVLAAFHVADVAIRSRVVMHPVKSFLDWIYR